MEIYELARNYICNCSQLVFNDEINYSEEKTELSFSEKVSDLIRVYSILFNGHNNDSHYYFLKCDETKNYLKENENLFSSGKIELGEYLINKISLENLMG